MGAFIKPVGIHEEEKELQDIDYVRFHGMLGHANENFTRATAKYLGYRTKNKHHVCVPCTLAKASRTPIIRQVTYHNDVGECFGINISGISTTSFGGYKYWNLKVCYG